MARTYDPQLLTAPDVANLAWARTWVRATLRDTPTNDAWPDGSYLDEEITGALAVSAVTNDSGTTLYRPHAAAAALIEADPTRAIGLKADDVSETLPDARSVAAGILKAGRSLEALVRAAGGPDSRRMPTVF